MESQPRIVIVAEDEFLIRCVAAEALTSAGFRVVEAADAADAFAALEQFGTRTAALFTDVRMPGAYDGMELARRARTLLPGLAILVASGHANPAAGEMPSGARFVSKPYSLAATARLICEMVAERAS